MAFRIGLAMGRHHPVTIEYTKLDGSTTLRTIEPYGTDITSQGKLILRSMDRTSREPRSWRVDRITAYTVHKGSSSLLEE